MTAIIATIIAALLVLGIIFLAVRSIRNNVKQGKGFDGCVGDCSHCTGCHH